MIASLLAAQSDHMTWPETVAYLGFMVVVCVFVWAMARR